MKITKAQKEALEVVMKLTDSNDPNKKEYILTLIYGILNLELEEDKTLTFIPNNGNDGIQINIPDWSKSTPIPPFTPGDYQPPQVWYNHETEPIQTNMQKNVNYATEVTCMGDKNCIVHTTNTNDVRYNGEYEEPKRN